MGATPGDSLHSNVREFPGSAAEAPRADEPDAGPSTRSFASTSVVKSVGDIGAAAYAARRLSAADLPVRRSTTTSKDSF